MEPRGGAGRVRWFVLGFGWIIFILSLNLRWYEAAPQSWDLFGNAKVWQWLLIFAAEPFVIIGESFSRLDFNWENLLGLLLISTFLWGTITFLISPLLVTFRNRARLMRLCCWTSVSMLSAWIPLFTDKLSSNQTSLLLGYYLLAGAYTLVFLAIFQLPKWPKRERRGFEVIVKDQ